MVSDLPGVLVDGTGIDQLDRIGNSSVQMLATRRRNAGQQSLTHQLMGKGEWLLWPLGTRDDYSHLLRLLDDGEEFVNIDLADLSQKPEAEATPDHRCGPQHPLFILVEPLQAAADDQAHVFRNVSLVDLDVSAELAGRVEDFALLDQMPKDLLDEKWISLAFFKDEIHQRFRSLPMAERMQHLRDGIP